MNRYASFLTIAISLGVGVPAWASADAIATPPQATATSAPANYQTITLDVPGMTCAFCPITVRKALEAQDGVIKAESSYDTKSATVTFDPTRTSPETLMQATADAGYPSTVKSDDR